MGEAAKKEETRIIPEEIPQKFYIEHLMPYDFMVKRGIINKQILEVGCGDGYGSAYLAKIADKVTGVDYEEEIIFPAQNKYKAPNLNFLCMDATKLHFEDNTFDLVCSLQVIEHIPEDKILLYLSEIKRVLKKGGEFYLSTLNLIHSIKSPKTYKKNPAHCKEFRLPELKELLLKVFPVIEIYGLHLTAKHNFFLRLKKIGIFNFLPKAISPVTKFYNQITTADFQITTSNLTKAIDFICVCKN